MSTVKVWKGPFPVMSPALGSISLFNFAYLLGGEKVPHYYFLIGISWFPEREKIIPGL